MIKFIVKFKDEKERNITISDSNINKEIEEKIVSLLNAVHSITFYSKIVDKYIDILDMHIENPDIFISELKYEIENSTEYIPIELSKEDCEYLKTWVQYIFYEEYGNTIEHIMDSYRINSFKIDGVGWDNSIDEYVKIEVV